jgi:hypothetical protein
MLGHGVEFWQYRDGKLAFLEAALNIWEAGTDNSRKTVRATIADRDGKIHLLKSEMGRTIPLD